MCPGTGVLVSLHAAGAATAAPAPSAGPHAARWAAWVWAWFADAAHAPLWSTLLPSASRTHTWQEQSPAKWESTFLTKVASFKGSSVMAESVICAHRSVWVGSQQSAQASVLLSWSCWWSGSCCGVHWQSPQFSKQVPSPSLVLLACCARERYNSNWETNQQQTPPKTTHYIYLYYWVNWVSACFYIKRQRYVLRYLSSRALKTLSVALVKYVCITWRHFQSSCGSSFPYYSLLQCQTLCSALSFSVLCSRLSARRGKQTGMTVGVFFSIEISLMIKVKREMNLLL